MSGAKRAASERAHPERCICTSGRKGGCAPLAQLHDLGAVILQAAAPAELTEVLLHGQAGCNPPL